MEDAVTASTAEGSGQIVVAGAGYAGLHVALRLTARLRNLPKIELILVDRHDYHQVITELPRVVGGTRAADAVCIPLQDTLATRVRFVQTEINGFDLHGRRLTLVPPTHLAVVRWIKVAGRGTGRGLRWRCRAGAAAQRAGAHWTMRATSA